jgi:hypothetical protein
VGAPACLSLCASVSSILEIAGIKSYDTFFDDMTMECCSKHLHCWLPHAKISSIRQLIRASRVQTRPRIANK